MAQAPTKAEDPKEVAKAMAKLEAVAGEARQRWTLLIKSCKEQMAYAKKMQDKWLIEREALKAYKDDNSKPQNNTYVTLDMLYQYYGNWHRMVEIELVAYQHNLSLAAPGNLSDALPFAMPLISFEYLEAKARKTLALSRYYMRYQIEGVDALLRATDYGFTITPVDEADQAKREGRGLEIKTAAAVSKPLQAFLEQVGPELREVKDLNRWGIDTFKRYDGLEQSAKNAVVHDPSWAKLESKFPLLQELHERTGPYPAVNQYTAKWTRETLPFALPEFESMAGVGEGGGAPKVGSDLISGIKPTTGSRASSLKLPDKK